MKPKHVPRKIGKKLEQLFLGSLGGSADELITQALLNPNHRTGHCEACEK